MHNHPSLKKTIVVLYSVLPILFIFSHGLVSVIVSSSFLLFFFTKVNFKNKITIPEFLFLCLSFYILLNGIINLNYNNFFLIRFLVFLIIFIYFIKSSNLVFINQLVTIFIVIIGVEFIILHNFNVSIFGNEFINGYFTSFFKDEKILGSYILRLYTISLIINLFNNDKRYIQLNFFLFPLVVYIIYFSGQRMPFINAIFFLTFVNILILVKLYLFNIKKLIAVLLFFILIIFNFSDYIKNKLKNSVSYIFEPSINFMTIGFKNNKNFEKIKFKNVIREKFDYDEVFAFGIKDHEEIPLSIKSHLMEDDRLVNKQFKVCNQTKFGFCDDIKNVFLLENKNLKKNETLFDVKSLDKFKFYYFDYSYYAHFRIAFEIWKKNPFFGIGIKNYRVFCNEKEYLNFTSFSKQFCPTHPHNFFFEILSELGLLGLILFYFFVISLIYYIFKSKILLINKISLIIILLMLFNPIQTSGRIFSSNEFFFNIFIFSIFLIFIRSNPNFKKIIF